MEELHLTDLPFHEKRKRRGVGSFEFDSIEAALRSGAKRNGRLEPLPRLWKACRGASNGYGLWINYLTQFLPLPSVVGDQDGNAQVLGFQVARRDEEDVNTVDLRSPGPASQLNLHPRARTPQVDGGDGVVVQEELPLELWQLAAKAYPSCDPVGEMRILDSICNQLGCQVVIVATGVIRGPAQRQIPVGQGICPQHRAKILTPISRVNTHASRVLPSRRGFHT
jgi:hypothetical protein